MKVAIIGAGWAGMAAAIGASQAGHSVTVLEAARTLGGRARAVTGTNTDGSRGRRRPAGCHAARSVVAEIPGRHRPATQ